MNLSALFQVLNIVLLCGWHSSQCQDSPSPLKVMTWNIWHGGIHGNAASSYEKDTSNTMNVVKILEAEDPDVLLMQETYCCGMEIAREAGFAHSWRGSSNLSIHSKYPIVDTISIFRPFNSHGAIIDVRGQRIMFVNVWLHYLPDYFHDIISFAPDSLIAGERNTRLKEIDAIIKAVDSLEQLYNIPVVIGGDFNSGSHLDWIESTRDYHYGKVVEWPVSKLMTSKGFVDTFREANPDPVQTLEGTWGFLNDEIISDRIDYIYRKGDILRTKKSSIVLDDPTNGFFNSDHRAIITHFEY